MSAPGVQRSGSQRGSSPSTHSDRDPQNSSSSLDPFAEQRVTLLLSAPARGGSGGADVRQAEARGAMLALRAITVVDAVDAQVPREVAELSEADAILVGLAVRRDTPRSRNRRRRDSPRPGSTPRSSPRRARRLALRTIEGVLTSDALDALVPCTRRSPGSQQCEGTLRTTSTSGRRLLKRTPGSCHNAPLRHRRHRHRPHRRRLPRFRERIHRPSFSTLGS